MSLSVSLRERERRLPVLFRRSFHRAPGTGIGRARDFLLRRWEVLLIAAITLDFVWMRLIDMQTSFWADESATAVLYVDGGLSGIYSSTAYSPNNHVLFSILSWLTVAVLGHDEPNYRIWSVLPAIASAAALFWWTRKRIDRVAAFVVAAVLLTAPMLLQWTVEARGYGMAQLGMVLAFIAAAEIEEQGPRRATLVLLSAGIFVAAGAHYASAPGLGLAALWLMRRPDLRRPVFKAAFVGALGVLLVQGALIPSIIRTTPQYEHEFKALGLKGLITGPVELGTGTGQLLFTGNYFRGCAAQCYSSAQLVEWGWLLFLPAMAGAASLWHRRRRGLLGCILVPLIGTFAVIIVTRIRVDDRFVMYLLPLYAVTAGVGVSAAVKRIGRRIIARPLLALIGTALLLCGAARIYSFNQKVAAGPAQDFKGLANAYAGTGIPTVVTNVSPGIGYGLQWYIGKRLVYDTPADLQRFLCKTSGPFTFIQAVDPITDADLNCLQARHAAGEDFPGVGSTLLRLWLVQTPAQRRFAPKVRCGVKPLELTCAAS